MLTSEKGLIAWEYRVPKERLAALDWARGEHAWEKADKGRGSKRRVVYSALRVSLDTETTTYRPRTLCGKRAPYARYEIKRDCSACPENAKNGGKCKPYAWVYVWQVCINGRTIVGRTVAEMLDFLESLAETCGCGEKRRVLVYVHNLSYDAAFFLHLLHRVEDDAIYTDRHKVLRVHTEEGLEFRCSYLLSGTSLAVVGRNLRESPARKLEGGLDYREIRTPETPLTAREIDYILEDVRVMDAYLKEQAEDYGGLTKLPLTNTGRVRTAMREETLKSSAYAKKVRAMRIGDGAMYKVLKGAFSGGVVHGGSRYVGKTVEDVGTCDIASSYPAQLLLRTYPMGSFTEAEPTIEKFRWYMRTRCVLVDVTLRDVRPRFLYAQVLPFYRAISSKGGHTLNNGKVVYADEIRYYLAGEELVNILRFYKCEFHLNRLWVARRGYMPREFISVMHDFYTAKTTLKGVSDRAAEYMLKKNMLNSTYGMCVTSLDMEDWAVNADGEFTKVISKDSTGYAEWLDGVIRQADKSKSRFLYYAWGVWVTVWARSQLYALILKVGSDFVYCDTDCVKFTNPGKYIPEIEKINGKIERAVRDAEVRLKLPMYAFSPKDPKGVRRTIGVWEYEGEYRRFKTLGAKRYMGEKWNSDKTAYKLEVTVAGCNKSQLCDWLDTCPWDPFDLFGPDLKVPTDRSGRLTMTYLDGTGTIDIIDMYGYSATVEYSRGIAAEPNEYDFSAQRAFIGWCRGFWERTERDG